MGIKTAEQIESIAPAADGELPIDDWHRVAGVIQKAKSEAEAASAD